MVRFNEFVLSNGLKVIVHEDPNTSMAVMNVLYKVGSRDERPEQTGFAHLFEHFMFQGSVNIPNFDTPLQEAGGESNAFTSSDITNYYEVLPAANLETAFWLESDRMLSLAFNEEGLSVQKNVVMEEFKEHYINQPYGDVWHKMSALAYRVHPYRWPTIGLSLAHIEQVELAAAKEFFFKFYRPRNAVLVVAGNIKTQKIEQLAQEWFGEIPSGESCTHELLQEPDQKEYRLLEVQAEVPVNALYMAYKMCGRAHRDYYAIDLLRDILSTGDSSRLYHELVKKQKLFSSISAYTSETIDAGLLMIEGKLNNGVSMKEAEQAVAQVLHDLAMHSVTEREWAKVENKMESFLTFGETNVLNRAMNLAYFDMLGDATQINEEVAKYRSVTPEDLQRNAQQVFRNERLNTIHYYSKNSK